MPGRNADVLLRSRRIFGLRSARTCKYSDPEHHDYADTNPQIRHSQQVRSDGKADDQNYEADQVGTE